MRESARELGYAGVEAYQAGDYVRANNALSRAYALLRAPSLCGRRARWLNSAIMQLQRRVIAK